MMKVIKRDGRIMSFDRFNIVTAIGNANNEVMESQKATNDEIKKIVLYIEELGKKRILAEDIQDIIEEKLIEYGKNELAQKYISYKSDEHSTNENEIKTNIGIFPVVEMSTSY